ncbi:hypothetical protein V6N12_036409 [Hibiscus sabdariffa]|uniref:Uncharacterized protein n=1 Tax=Hibiscus sabdariffa TaxID=183260 RepID=A0ABR2EQI6_9ROSI
MYPAVETMPENPPTPTYPTAGHPGLVPASGFPNIQPHPIHHHPYISRVPSAPIQGRWTSGLCHCFDDPVNCWEANMDRQKRGVTMAPIVVPGMAR